jgi:hypothetical protein
MRQLPISIKVEYERARSYQKKEVPDAIWDYTIKEADGDGAHGFAGGLLIKTPDGLWQAHYWKHASGAPAKTREQAILNVLPLAAELCDKWEAERATYEGIYDARWKYAATLQNIFPECSGLVTVHDITATRQGPSPEARYKVTFTFDNLTEMQVGVLAANQNKGII